MKTRAITIWLAPLALVSFISSSVLAKEQVPIKGEFVTEFLFSQPPPVAQLTLTGNGQVSHLGKAACFCGNEVVDFTMQPPTMTGTLELAAANGDKLIGEMNGVVVPAADGSITFTGTLTITSGTGRFAQVTAGTAEFAGFGIPTSAEGGVGWFVIDGTVMSPGASKK